MSISHGGYRTTLWLRAHAHWPKIEKPENHVFCPKTAKLPLFNFIFACRDPCIIVILRAKFQLKAPNTRTCRLRAAKNHVLTQKTAQTPPFNFIFGCRNPCIIKIVRAKFQFKIPTTRTSRSRAAKNLDFFFLIFF